MIEHAAICGVEYGVHMAFQGLQMQGLAMAKRIKEISSLSTQK
jgi:hypothetical protein